MYIRLFLHVPACSPQAAYLCLTQLLDYKHELVLLLVNTLLSDLKNDNFVVISTALVVASKLIGADLINAGEPCDPQALSTAQPDDNACFLGTRPEQGYAASSLEVPLWCSGY